LPTCVLSERVLVRTDQLPLRHDVTGHVTSVGIQRRQSPVSVSDGRWPRRHAAVQWDWPGAGTHTVQLHTSTAY